MARTQSAKHFKQQRKVATNFVQILPTRQAVDQPLSKNVDPPPIYSESPPSEPAYLSFSELYYTNAASLRSSSAETLVSDYSPAPMDWDRETLYDPTVSFRDSFYKTPDEDELPIPGKDFIFGTPFIPDSPTLSSYSSPPLCEQQLIPTLGGDILMVDNFSAPEEDVSIDGLRNEFEEKLIIEQTVIPMEVDVEMTPPPSRHRRRRSLHANRTSLPLQAVLDLPNSAHAPLDMTPPSLSLSVDSLLLSPSLRANLSSGSRDPLELFHLLRSSPRS